MYLLYYTYLCTLKNDRVNNSANKMYIINGLKTNFGALIYKYKQTTENRNSHSHSKRVNLVSTHRLPGHGENPPPMRQCRRIISSLSPSVRTRAEIDQVTAKQSNQILLKAIFQYVATAPVLTSHLHGPEGRVNTRKGFGDLSLLTPPKKKLSTG